MSEAVDVHPVLEYRTPEAQDVVAFMGPMRLWRRIAGWAFWLMLAGVILYDMLALVGLAVLLVAGALTLFYMFRAAASEVSMNYACPHLLLAIVLTPLLFLGIFLVPRLVEADLINWRLAERPVGNGPANL